MRDGEWDDAGTRPSAVAGGRARALQPRLRVGAVTMPKAKTRSAPQWRTAPGLGTGPAVGRDAADPGQSEEPQHAHSPAQPRARRREPPHDSPIRAAPEPPEPATAEVPPTSIADPALYTHTVADRAAEVPDHGPAVGADTALAEKPELAAPQVPLTVELPGPRRTSRGSVEQGHRPRPDSTIVRAAARRESFARSVRSLEPISDLEAASFAGRFASDFQSFDEDNPSRRAEVLRSLLADPQACTWGWSGAGRQRADSPLPGRIFRSSDTVVFVEVVVRATTYARACSPPEPAPPPDPAEVEPAGVLGPSCAPPEADPGWVAVAAHWLRMTVPITRDPDDGRLVVDPHLVSDQSS